VASWHNRPDVAAIETIRPPHVSFFANVADQVLARIFDLNMSSALKTLYGYSTIPPVSKSTYRVARDGLPARVSGHWAQEKLQVLQRYLDVVVPAMKKSDWGGLCYVDLLAGGGRCVLESGEEFDGSPLIALRCTPPFSSAVFVEQDPRLVAALKARTIHRNTPCPTIIAGNCNDTVVIAAIRRAVPANTLAVTFVDNLGWEVSLSAISRIVANRRMDLVVTFQVSALKRNLARALSEPAIATQWDGFFKHPLGQKFFRAVSESVDDPSFDFDG
jgi:three-Cys-motif partner protein